MSLFVDQVNLIPLRSLTVQRRKHCEEEEHSSKLHIELHNSDAKKTNNEEPCFHKSTGKKCLGSTSILISEVLKDEDTYHTPRIDLRESSPSDQDTVVSFHTKRFSLEDAWEESRKNIEPANAWDQPMPKSKKDCDWELLNEENIGGLKPVGFINAVKRGTQVRSLIQWPPCYSCLLGVGLC